MGSAPAPPEMHRAASAETSCKACGPGTTSSCELYVCTWNVSGISLEHFDTFIDQLNDHDPWDVLLLQEAFRCVEGIEVPYGHLLFTPESLFGGLRCPAILVNERWKHNVKLLSCGFRWLAVDFDFGIVFASLHLPHRDIPVEVYQTTLDELGVFLEQLNGKCVHIGVDANTCMTGVVDHVLVGEAVPAIDDLEPWGERAQIFHEFLADHRLMLVNTFANIPASDWHTRFDWAGAGASQIDFLAVTPGLNCLDTGVDHAMDYSTDHRLIWASFALGSVRPPRRQKRCMRNWKPSPTWHEAALQQEWLFCDWDAMATTWRAIAETNAAIPARSPRDIELANLLLQWGGAERAQRRSLNKQIWRRRRLLRRRRLRQQLAQALLKGSAPPGRRSTHINWIKLFSGRDASTDLKQFHLDLYSLNPEDEVCEHQAKLQTTEAWLHIRAEIPHVRVSALDIRRAVCKLRLGKGSSDGVTAEMFKALPGSACEALAAYFEKVMAELCIPTSWTYTRATLVPKVVGAESLAKFRTLASLPTARKLLGYLWMSMLPPLSFETFQTGFVKGCRASSGVYAIGRAVELSREWDLPIYAAQLDLRRAFDRVKHSACLKALLLQGASQQCMAVFCAILQQSSLQATLGHIGAEGVTLCRGLPQGAPESPIVFVMVMEMVLRTLQESWRKRGLGWQLDAFWLCVVCYADDVVLLATSKQSLSIMVLEVVYALEEVGLSVSAGKSHWTSWPRHPGDSFRIGPDDILWEARLTFVGTVLDFSGSSSAAVDYRMAQATKVFHRWKPLLLRRWLEKRRRLKLASRAILTCVLWLAETWHPTKTHVQRLDSWGARMMARIAAVKRGGSEEIGGYWRRTHRVGHALLA